MDIKKLLLSPKNRERGIIWRWIESFAVNGDKAVKFNNGLFAEYIFERSRLRKYTHSIRNINDLFKDSDLRFVIFGKKETKKDNLNLKDNWRLVFEGLYFSVFEDENKTLPPRPLRFGLDINEKKIALDLARKSLEYFLEKGEKLDLAKISLPARFNFKTSADVSLWVGGQLRGSQIVQNMDLKGGIAKVAIAAAANNRFKPLTLEELPKTRIEITIIHGDEVPLSREFIKKNKIMANRGYFLSLGRKKGWFLPVVFNSKRFTDLKIFLRELASEKAGLSKNSWYFGKIKTETFSVEDFMEGENQEGIFDLWGPIFIPKKKELSKEDNELNNKLESMLKQAGNWLLKMQEADGNFRPIINPLTGANTQIDWPRSALSAWSLSELSLATGENKYQESAQKYFYFLKKYLKNDKYPVYNDFLVSSYAGEIALSFCRREREYFQEALSFSKPLIPSEKQIRKTNPVTIGQAISFLSELLISARELEDGYSSENIMAIIRHLADFIKNDFELKSTGPNCNLAIWAELVHSFRNLFLIFENKFDREFVFRITDWMISFQKEDGSFWGTNTDPDFVYVRNTGKIFEVLPDALNMAKLVGDKTRIEKYEKAIELCLTWLSSMQYDCNNAFFVKHAIRGNVIGGFRHDYFNQEAWIDAAAHFILGGTRLLKLRK